MIARRSVLLLPLFAAACADDDAAPRVFSPPNYSFLTPIRLNVASIQIDDRSPPNVPNGLDGSSPVRPLDALKEMANDRLVAGGSAGRAVFVIDQASIVRAAGGINGTLAVHLDVYAGDGDTLAGFAEARVVRRRTSNDLGENSAGVLYDFTTQMMADMNVEFEFQVKRTLHDWLQMTDATAPPPAPVQTQDLAAPPGTRSRPPPAPTPEPAAAATPEPVLPDVPTDTPPP